MSQAGNNQAVIVNVTDILRSIYADNKVRQNSCGNLIEIMMMKTSLAVKIKIGIRSEKGMKNGKKVTRGAVERRENEGE